MKKGREYAFYIFVAVCAAALAYCAVNIALNWGLISFALSVPEASARIMLFSNLAFSLRAYTSTFSLVLILASIALFGVNVALVVYQIRRGVFGAQKGVVGMLVGAVASVIGIGCAACGSLLLAGSLSLGAFIAVVAWLPLHGMEFGIIGLLVMGASTYFLAIEARKPLVC